MSLSDCIKCWSTPCICGHEYKFMSDEGRIQLIRAILRDVDDEEKAEQIYQKARNLICDCKAGEEETERGHNNCWNCDKPLSI